MNLFKFYLSSIRRILTGIFLLLIVILLCALRFPAIAVKEVIFDPLTWVIDGIAGKISRIHDEQKQARVNYEKTP